ncbi:MAG: 50S ribosomal protein L25 [Chloroflexota bacterium]
MAAFLVIVSWLLVEKEQIAENFIAKGITKMADHITIVAEPRDVVGKQVRALRRDGWVPGVVYGQNEPVNVQMEWKALRRALREAGTSHLVDLQVDGGVRTVLVREIQQHATRGDIVHVDFMEVDTKTEITAEADIVLVGHHKVNVPGAVIQTQQTVNISCLPDDLVAEIEVDISSIASVHDLVHVSNIVAPKGVTILDDDDILVARYEAERVAVEGEEEEMGVYSPEVEVISRAKDEDNF